MVTDPPFRLFHLIRRPGGAGLLRLPLRRGERGREHDPRLWCRLAELHWLVRGARRLPPPGRIEHGRALRLRFGGLRRKVPTIEHHLSAIAQAHQLASVDPSPTLHPDVKRTMKGIRRTLGRSRSVKAALTTGELRLLVGTCDPGSLAGLRDAALLVLGFASSCRRSELVALDVEDLEETEEGLRIRIVRSKSDPEAQGREIGLPYGSNLETCPVRTLRAWLGAGGRERGPLFCPVNRHDQAQEGPTHRQGRGPHRSARLLEGGLGSEQIRGAQSPPRVCDYCCEERRPTRVNQASDRASLRRGPRPLHRGEDSVRAKRRRIPGAVAPAWLTPLLG